MNRRTMIISLSVILALILVGCQPEEDSPPSPPPVDTPEPVETPDGPSIPMTGDEWISQGESVYVAQCETCHGPDGEGLDAQFPALDANSFVLTADPDPVIDLVLNGRAQMPPFRDQLTDEEIAQVVSYIRNAWSNDASIVAEEEVAEQR
jgi:cytochrome c oxidase subunit II